LPDDGTAGLWTARLRRRALRTLPPAKLLPDSQPAYVASWIYVFGVGSLAALGVAIASGFALALGGPDWWHYNSVGHFFNSLHLWSVELFMALLVIHLWGKFWMAVWRGRRTWTWITGVVAGAATILLLGIPFIPGLRDIPRVIPVHKLIWRHWDGSPPEPGAEAGPVSPRARTM
jgi:ubiquinol-cytochrome c reductase cytochrome b subunit